VTAGSQYFYILSTNNSTKIWQNSKSLLGMSIETRTSRLVQKNWSLKISLDCPFNLRQPSKLSVTHTKGFEFIFLQKMASADISQLITSTSRLSKLSDQSVFTFPCYQLNSSLFSGFPWWRVWLYIGKLGRWLASHFPLSKCYGRNPSVLKGLGHEIIIRF
jgi:hypothetical protein